VPAITAFPAEIFFAPPDLHIVSLPAIAIDNRARILTAAIRAR